MIEELLRAVQNSVEIVPWLSTLMSCKLPSRESTLCSLSYVTRLSSRAFLIDQTRDRGFRDPEYRWVPAWSKLSRLSHLPFYLPPLQSLYGCERERSQMSIYKAEDIDPGQDGSMATDLSPRSVTARPPAAAGNGEPDQRTLEKKRVTANASGNNTHNLR